MLKKASIILKNKNIHFLWFLIPSVIVTIIAVWLLPLEDKANLINSPNQKGITSFTGQAYSISIDGGFLYRLENKKDLPKQLTIKKNAPHTTINLNSNKNSTLKINLINISLTSEVTVNGQPTKIFFQPANTKLSHQLQANRPPPSGVVNSKDYLDDQKGAYIYVKLKPGDNTINVNSISDTQDLKFAVFSDFHSGYSVGFKGLIQIIKENPDFIISNGDLVNFGNKAEYIVAAGVTETSPIAFYMTIGNHENWQNGAKFFKHFFGPPTKSFTYKNSLFVFADNHTGYIPDSQFIWLESILSNSSAKNKFVFIHMPAIDAHSGVFDNRTYRHPQSRHNMYDKQQSDRLINLLNKYKVDALFAGHDHIYSNFKLGNVTQATSGALGGKVREPDTLTYLLVTVNSGEVVINNKYIDGAKGAYNLEHISKLRLVKTFAGPYFSDKKVRLSLTIFIIFITTCLVFTKIFLKVKK
jgi:predicted phosphodiesterase